MRDETRTWADWKATGSREALIALLEAHRDGVYNLCYPVVRHVQDAEDAAQKVLLELLDHLPGLADAGHLRRWLHRACFHISLKLLRSRKRRMEHEARKGRQAASADAPDSSDEREALHEHLASLDGEDQSLLVDHYFQRKSLPELAQEQGVSTVAVWKKLERARGRLRAALTLSGLAAAALTMDSSLEAIEIAAPPAGPLPPVLLAKATSVTAAGMALAAAGGTTMKGASIAIAVLIGLCAAGGVGLASFSRIRHREVLSVPRDGRATTRTAEALAPAPDRPVAVEAGPATPPAGPAARPLRTFSSVEAFVEAFVAACAIDDDAARWQALRGLGVELSDQDFGRALAEARTRAARGHTTVRKSLPKIVLNLWRVGDPKAYLNVWLRIPDIREAGKGEYWKDGVVDPLRRWARQDPAAALDFIQSRPYSRDQGELAELAWAMADPDTYVTTLLRSPPGESRLQKLEFAIRALAGKDPSAAVRRLAEMPDPEERRHATSAAFGEIGRTDLDKAILLVRDVADPETRDVVVMSLTYALMQKDAERAIALAGSVGNEHRRSMVLGEILALQARQDPARVPELIRRFPSSALASRYADVAGAWAKADPAAALAWSLALPDSEETRVTLMTEGVATEISSREHAAGKAIDAWAAKEPREALDWIHSSSFAEAGRRRLRAEALTIWARRDRPAAVRWISESALPSDEKAALMRTLRR